MKRFWNRDSIVFTLLAVGALVGYLLSDGRVPTEWGYTDWLQFIAFVVAYASGKLATSPLPGAQKEQ